MIDKTLIFKTIENNFRHIRYIEKEYMLALSDNKKSNKSGGNNGNAYISDPTANQAVNLVEPPIKSIVIKYSDYKGRYREEEIRRPDKWIDLFYKVKRAAQKDFFYRSIFHDRYIRGWNHVQTEVSLNISKKTYFNLRNDIVNLAIAGACQLNLIKIL